jgi:Na+/H+ antiporter NhaD/arsenite permease-like protein
VKTTPGRLWALMLLLAAPLAACAAGDGTAFQGARIAGISVEFVLFAVILTGVAVLHDYTLPIAFGGAVVIALYKIIASPFRTGAGVEGFLLHLGHEWVILSNLLLLLVGFALLAQYFEESRVPDRLPHILPDDWKGGFVLLVLVFFLSSFLDNIAAAMIGGAIALIIFKGNVHIGYLAAIVAASNGGGAGSVVGDTTTTMLWISGISPLEVIEAFIAAAVALVISGVIAARQQHALQPIQKDATVGVEIDWACVAIVAFILVMAVVVNVTVSVGFNDISDAFPFLGTAVWVAILASVPVRRPKWHLIPRAAKGALFLVSLVLAASMMPVDQLPPASWQTAFTLGFVSAVFDNIPLTALAIKQGGYDWGFLAFAVGYGGSMIWFGSSAGVALSNIYPQAKSVGQWLRHGWHVAVGYIAGFFVMLALIGFHPGGTPRGSAAPAPAAAPATK